MHASSQKMSSSRSICFLSLCCAAFCLLFLTHCTTTPGSEKKEETTVSDSGTDRRSGDLASPDNTTTDSSPDKGGSEPAPTDKTEPVSREENVSDTTDASVPEEKVVSDTSDGGTGEVTPEPTPDVAPDSSPDNVPDNNPPKKACSPPSAGSWKAITAKTYRLGNFSLEVASNNLLQFFDVNRPKVVLFQIPRQNPVIAEKVDVKIEEHQGSFSIVDKVKSTCRQSRIDQVAVDGQTVSLRGSYTDTTPGCSKLKFEWHFCLAGTGQLRFVLNSSDPGYNALSLRLGSSSKERLWGMGVQFLHNDLNLKGKKIPALVQEGGVGRGHQPISAAVNTASKGSAGSEVSTYYSMPWFMTERWSGFLLENNEVSVFDFKASDTLTVRLFGSSMRGRILSASSPLQMMERLTAYTGRMPALPDWVNQGAIVALARSLKDSEKHIKALLSKGTKIAGIWNQTWPGKVKTYIGEQVLWNWAYNPHYHPDWTKFVAGLKQKGIRVLCYINPMFVDVPKEAGKVTRNLFKEGKAKGYFIRNQKGDTYLIKVTAFNVSLLDLTNPAARKWIKDVIKDEMIKKAGCSGWMADFAEALPFDAKMHSGIKASVYHNQYPVDWIRLHKEALKESGNLGKILVFNRSGYTLSPKHSILLWQGDQLTTWDKYDGLVSALHGLINGGLSGVSLNHSDTGGYTSLSYLKLGYTREAELLKRWAEMNAFTAVLRTHEGNQPTANAQIYSNNDALEHFARMSRIYNALAFYRKTLFQEAATKGWPVVRHLMLHYPNDSGSRTTDKQFLLGSEILVAPILNKCWTRPFCPYNKEVYLPPGRWVHLWTGKSYGSTSKGSKVTVKAPIGKPAVFYKAGSQVGKTFVANLKKNKVSGLP